MKTYPRPTTFRLLVLSLVLILGVAACDFTATPQEATNEVGTEHTVSANVDHPDGAPWSATFTIISGPNAGLNSATDGTCNNCAGTGTDTAQWTYESNGTPGTDVIRVCVDFPPFGDLCTGDVDFQEDVTKEWIVVSTPTPTPTRTPTQVPDPGFAPDLFTATPTRTLTATPTRTATPVATIDPRLGEVAAIQPPSTGDGGVSGGGLGDAALFAIATAVIGICTASLALRRSRNH
jgi:hypothetical protein